MTSLDDYHGAVVQEPDSLGLLLALLGNVEIQFLAGYERWFKGVGKVVDVEDPDALELGDLVQVEVGGEE